MRRIPFVLAFAMVFTPAAFAAKTYTPAELRKMVSAGHYPKQGPINSNKVVKLDYAAYVVNMEQMLDAIKPNYPSITVISTNLLRTDKAWTNDGALTITCAAGVNEMTVTIAPYL